MATDGDAFGLPPRPDPETGEPIPLTAPTQTAGGYPEKRWAPPPGAPGQGPTLAYFREKRPLTWLGGFIPVLLVMIIVSVFKGIDTLLLWPVWLLLAVLYGWTVFVHRANVLAAGADWVQIRKYWVKTYELVQIHYRPYGTSEPCLMLADSDGRNVEIPLGVLEGDHTTWNYIYLGMRHSAACGAEINPNALGMYPELHWASSDFDSDNPR